MKARFAVIAALLLLFGVVVYTALRPPMLVKEDEPETPEFAYYIIVEEDSGQELVRLPHQVDEGDRWIHQDNHVYQVVRVEGNRAFARFVGIEELPEVPVQ